MALMLEAIGFTSIKWAMADREFHRAADLTSVVFALVTVIQFSRYSVHGIYEILRVAPVLLVSTHHCATRQHQADDPNERVVLQPAPPRRVRATAVWTSHRTYIAICAFSLRAHRLTVVSILRRSVTTLIVLGLTRGRAATALPVVVPGLSVVVLGL